MNWLANISKSLRQGIGDLSPTCKQSVQLQSAALDTKLPLRQRLGLKIHLMLCRWCRRYGKQIGFLREATREHGGEERALPPRSLSPEARERIKQRLEAEKK
jgi:predicted anti-sigma-YlaC factor YlaD